jgi:hypothetical protein
MLGAGFPAETIRRGIELGATAIAVDGGSTDSGPYALGTGTAKTTAEAVSRDLRVLLTAARRADIPLVVTSCGTAGTDRGLQWVEDQVREIAAEAGLAFTLATIASEQPPEVVKAAIAAGRVTPLPPAGPLTPESVASCVHIVALMGAEPIIDALAEGADVVLAGRATDTASVAAIALRAGLPAGPSWHAAKTVECGGLCTTKPLSGGVLVEVDNAGFTVEPLDPTSRCTPHTVAAHMLYENADPYRMREPSGTLDTTDATYIQVDPRRVRVEGSRFEPADQYTNKLEGSALAGYETISLAGIRDPEILADLDTWTSIFLASLRDRVRTLLDLADESYCATVHRYGYDAILGPLDVPQPPPREVGVVLKIRAPDQATATAIAKIANPLLLHQPLPGMTHMPSFAFATSPAEIERGAVYEFVLNHVVAVASPTEMFRMSLAAVGSDV